MAYNPSQYTAANRAGDTFTGPILTSGKKASYRSVSANTTLIPGSIGVAGDEHVEVTGSTAVTITLPDAVANNKTLFNVKNSGTAIATVAAAAGQLIDGSNTFSIGVQYQAITVISNGAGWSIY